MKCPSIKSLWDRLCTAAIKAWFWMPQLIKAYGWRFVAMCFFGEHLLKGFLVGGGLGGFFTLESRMYLLMQVKSSERQVLTAISGSPWALKPIFGMISDLVVMWKYRRTPWIIISAVLAVICYIVILVCKASLPAMIIAICFFFGRMQCSWTDLMIEACYSEKMKYVPDRASDIVTWVWIGIGLGGLIATIVVTPCLDNWGPFTSIAIPLAVAGLPIVPAALGWLTEEKCSTPSCGIRWDIMKQKKKYFGCAVILAICVLTSVGCGIGKVSTMNRAIVAVVVSVAVFIGAAILLPHMLWGPMLYMFLANALALSTTGFVDNFYLDVATPAESAATGMPVCVDCPHFTNFFYTTIVGVWDSLFMMLGSWIFNYCMSDWTYRKALVVTQLLVMFSNLCDIVQFQRWNKAISIPDWVFMLGKAALQNSCSMLNFLPTTILISKLCPVGAESTVFALLAGFSNFGQTISSYLGAYVQTWIGLGDIGNGDVDDFRNAWIASVINACCPIAVLLIMPFLIPDARMSDTLMKIDSEEEAKSIPSFSDDDQNLSARDIDIEGAPLSPAAGPAPTPTGRDADWDEGTPADHLRETSEANAGKEGKMEEEVRFRA